MIRSLLIAAAAFALVAIVAQAISASLAYNPGPFERYLGVALAIGAAIIGACLL